MSDSELAKIKGLAEEIDANEMVPAGFFAPTVVRLCDRLESSEAALRTLRQASQRAHSELVATHLMRPKPHESLATCPCEMAITIDKLTAALAAEGGK